MVDVRVESGPVLDGPKLSSLLEFKAFPSTGAPHIWFSVFGFWRFWHVFARMCVCVCVCVCMCACVCLVTKSLSSSLVCSSSVSAGFKQYCRLSPLFGFLKTLPLPVSPPPPSPVAGVHSSPPGRPGIFLASVDVARGWARAEVWLWLKGEVFSFLFLSTFFCIKLH